MYQKVFKFLSVLVFISLARAQTGLRGEQSSCRYPQYCKPNRIQDYSAYRQPDDIISGRYDDYSRNPSNLCTRKCGDRPKICYYRFELQPYSALGSACGNCPTVPSDCNLPQCVPADGFRKSTVFINRMYPGPSIQVCLNDTIVVDLHNTLIGKQSTLHWHGILQKETPWMDGVYMVTQCPVTPGQTFRYKFKADRPGTHYWHDHSGAMKLDGVQSSLVVREPPNYHNNMDQHEFDLPSHVLFLTDWKHYVSDVDIPDEQVLNNTKQIDSLLINGKGIYINDPTQNIRPRDHYNGATRKTPLHVISMRKGSRYRLRLVGGTCMVCGVRFSIDKHRFLVVGSDGDSVRPTLVDYVNVFPGERFDIVVNANQPIDTYWVIVQGVGVGGACQGSYGMGLLKYSGSTRDLPAAAQLTVPNNPLTANSIEGGCTRNNEICMSQLQDTKPTPYQIYEYRGNFRQLIQFGFYQYNTETNPTVFQTNTYLPFFEPIPNIQVRSLINNISFPEPPAVMLTQPNDIPQNLFCSARCKTYLQPRECICLDPIRVRLNSVVDIIVTDTSRDDGLTHPFHLHGHIFYVLEMGEMGSNYDTFLRGLMRRVESGDVAVRNPPGKDTVVIPNGGYVIIRFIANNPGMWFMHCHFLYHHLHGMSTILQVGNYNQFKPPPPGFPKCNNFYANY